jgi:hypothetical protein
MKHLIWVIALVLPQIATAKGAFFVITPGWDSTAFQCKIAPAQNPPVVENDLIKFKVTVKGGTGPFDWRLPLYQNQRNGRNDVTLARIGTVSLDEEKAFYIDLNVADLEKTDKDELEVRIRSQERFETYCKTPAGKVKQLASSVPPKELTVMEGKVGN